MVVIDATFLLLLLNPHAKVPGDSNGIPIVRAKERIDLLIATLRKSKQTVLIPTPVLSEVLLIAQSSVSDLVDQINKFSVFEVVPFDQVAAIELAVLARTELGKKDKGQRNSTTYAKLKYDRQIYSIAKVRGASEILSDDGHLNALGKKFGLKVTGLAGLPLPPQNEQDDLFESANEKHPARTVKEPSAD
jgi:hypothetical protein